MDSSIFFGDKRLGLTVLLLIVVGIAIIGCGKDAPLSPEEETFLSQEEAKTALVGIWQRTFSTGIVDIGTTYSNRLAFTEDGSYGYSSKKGVYNEGPEIKLGTYSVLKNVISVVAIDSGSIRAWKYLHCNF